MVVASAWAVAELTTTTPQKHNNSFPLISKHSVVRVKLSEEAEATILPQVSRQEATTTISPVVDSRPSKDKAHLSAAEDLETDPAIL